LSVVKFLSKSLRECTL